MSIFGKDKSGRAGSPFFINKFYLTKIFKETQGITISGYILEKGLPGPSSCCDFRTGP